MDMNDGCAGSHRVVKLCGRYGIPRVPSVWDSHRILCLN